MERNTDARYGDLVFRWDAEQRYWVLLETDRVTIGLRAMLVNFRVVETLNDLPLHELRFWCFEGRSERSYVTAVLAVLAWGGDEASEPAGWLKSWDGRYGGSLADDPFLPH